jgi:hypothetical protein
MSLKVLWMPRDTVASEIARTDANNSPYPSQGYRDKRRIVQMSDANGGIETFLHEVHASVDEQKLDADVGVAPHELVQNASDWVKKGVDVRVKGSISTFVFIIFQI